jgi:Zn-dependent protease
METIAILVQIAALVLAVSVHESAHGWVALRCGDPTARDLGRITLNPLRHIDPMGSVVVPALLAFSGAPVFGWAKPVPISLAHTRHPRSANLWISAAGPASNIVFAAIMTVAVLALRAQGSAFAESVVLQTILLFGVYSVLINVILAVFNLLPIPPLDGFGVVESLVPPSWYPVVAQMRRWGMLLLLVVIFSGALSSILQPIQSFVVNLLVN